MGEPVQGVEVSALRKILALHLVVVTLVLLDEVVLTTELLVVLRLGFGHC